MSSSRRKPEDFLPPDQRAEFDKKLAELENRMMDTKTPLPEGTQVHFADGVVSPQLNHFIGTVDKVLNEDAATGVATYSVTVDFQTDLNVAIAGSLAATARPNQKKLTAQVKNSATGKYARAMLQAWEDIHNRCYVGSGNKSGGPIVKTEVLSIARDKLLLCLHPESYLKTLKNMEPLPEGSYVLVSGLKSKPELNGLVGIAGTEVGPGGPGSGSADLRGEARYSVVFNFRSELTRAIAGVLSMRRDLPESAATRSLTTTWLDMHLGGYAGLGKCSRTETRSTRQPDGTMKTTTSGGDPLLKTATYSLKRANLDLCPDVEVYRKALQLRFTGHDEDAEMAEAAASDGELTEAKAEKHQQECARRYIGNNDSEKYRNPALNFLPNATASDENPILMVGGFGNCDKPDGSNSTADALFREGKEQFEQWRCRFLSFKDGNSAKASDNIANALRSGQYRCCVLADPGCDRAMPKLVKRLGPALKTFVEKNGGIVVAWSAGGDVFCREFLNKVWTRKELDWTWCGYGRADHDLVKNANAERLFGEECNWLSVKAHVLRVPESERCFASSEQGWDAAAALAVKEFPGGGKLVYFGDINGEDPWPLLCFMEKLVGKGAVETGSSVSSVVAE